MKIGFIGAGKVGEALSRALVERKLFKREEIIVSDISKERLDFVNQSSGINITGNNKKVVEFSDVLVLAVKPQDMKPVLEEIKDLVDKKQLVISIAAGVTIDFLSKYLPKRRIIRVMSNLALTAGAGMTAYAMNYRCGAADRFVMERIFASVGECIEVKEELLDAFTAIAGSGPAFFAFLIDVFVKAGKQAGFNDKEAHFIAEQTARGTGKLLQELNMKPSELVKLVSTPRGTTIAGFAEMDQKSVEKELLKAIEAATKRSKELGKKLN